MLEAAEPFLNFAAPTGALVWTVALSAAVADLLGRTLAGRLRWFLYSLWCGGPGPPAGSRPPGESDTALAEEVLAAKAAQLRAHSFGDRAAPLYDALGKSRPVGGRGQRSKVWGGLTVSRVGRESDPGGAAARGLDGARGESTPQYRKPDQVFFG